MQEETVLEDGDGGKGNILYSDMTEFYILKLNTHKILKLVVHQP